MIRYLIRTALLATALVWTWSGSALCLWQTFGPSDGLASAATSSVMEDRSGNLWFATNAGVSRFDGTSWHSYTAADGLPLGEGATAVLEDRSGNIWVGTYEGGISRYDGKNWRTYTTADGLLSNRVHAILEDHLGNIWIATGAGGGSLGSFSRFDGARWVTYGAAGYAYSIIEDLSGNIWVGTLGDGVGRFDGTGIQTYRTADGLADNWVTSALADRSGNVWFGTSNGLSRFDGATWQTYTTADGLPGNSVAAIYEDHLDNLWFGTVGDDGGAGLTRFDGIKWQTYTTADGLPDNYVRSILEDRWGNLWLVNGHGGVTRFDRTTWRRHTTPDPLPDNSQEVTAMLEDRSGNLWVGTQRAGVCRFDGRSWRTYTAADGLAFDWVTAIVEDRSGNLWFGTAGNGVSRFDGVNWRTYTADDGLAHGLVTSILEDRSGDLWFGTTYDGVSRFDGVNWRTYTTADGLGSNQVNTILEDRLGNLWFGTQGGGVSRFDGTHWRTYTIADGLPYNEVRAILEDRSGALWFATAPYDPPRGLTRFDGSSWRTYTAADGLADDHVTAMAKDGFGNLWFGTYGSGVSRFDGMSWQTYTTVDGLADNRVTQVLGARSGDLWFATLHMGGMGNYVPSLTRYETDLVPPRTAFLSKPPSVGASRNVSAAFVAAFSESKIEFSYRLDEGAWSSWSPVGTWVGTNLSDGVHTLEATSRDYVTNVDPFPPEATFEVDATPPAPLLTSPAFGAVVRGALQVRGSADDARLQDYRVEVRLAGARSWDPPIAALLAQSSVSVRDGPLATWDTSPLADGLYDLRLSATDSLGLTGSSQVTVVVDNHAPFADVTAPTIVSSSTGGNVFTTNAEAHLYFPPHAFEKDAVVTVTPAVDPSVPARTLPAGTIQLLGGYDIEWGGAPLMKPARLEFSYATGGAGAAAASRGAAGSDAGGARQAAEHLALYRSSNGTWERIGGTTDPSAARVSLAITAPGTYALFVETGVISGPGTLSSLAFTPRVFSPTGGFADRELGISFTLGRAAPVTVRVYSRSGRLIREVVAGQTMNAGANLVRWDGRDRNGGYAADGMYLVTVEALGWTERKTLAVVR